MPDKNGAMTPDEQVRDGGRTLAEVGQLIMTAEVLRVSALLNWGEIAGFLTETLFSAAEGAGFEHNEVAPRIQNAIKQDELLDEIKRHRAATEGAPDVE